MYLTILQLSQSLVAPVTTYSNMLLVSNSDKNKLTKVNEADGQNNI